MKQQVYIFTTMEKINLERDHVPCHDGGLECTWAVEPLKLTHLVKTNGIRQANGIYILDALSAL
jgi:Zn-finger protein